MAKTFADLGIPFPLFEGPVENASEYAGVATCSLCQRDSQHCFTLDIGGDIMVACPACQTLTGLDASDRESAACRQCKTPLPFPAIDDDEIKVCYACLRKGKAALTKDTQLGMIRWNEAVAGITHGTPGLNHPDFEMVPLKDDWTGAKLSPDIMFELLRTPTYVTIQGECWQFCCRQPMIFLGEWSRKEFTRRAPDGNGQRFFNEIVQNVCKGLWEDQLHDETGVYVFRCAACGRKTAHWDIA